MRFREYPHKELGTDAPEQAYTPCYTKDGLKLSA